jgi:hypothetical protein
VLKRGAILLALVLVVAVAAVEFRARRRTAAWWTSIERICACHVPAMRQLDDIARTASGGLDRVARAQRQALAGECTDLRAAMTRRTWSDRASEAPLRVVPERGHREAAREVARAMGLMCGDEHREFWAALTARVEGRTPESQSDDPRIVRAAREYVRIRESMCMRRLALTMPPQPYTLTREEAARTAAECR